MDSRGPSVLGDPSFSEECFLLLHLLLLFVLTDPILTIHLMFRVTVGDDDEDDGDKSPHSKSKSFSKNHEGSLDCSMLPFLLTGRGGWLSLFGKGKEARTVTATTVLDCSLCQARWFPIYCSCSFIVKC